MSPLMNIIMPGVLSTPAMAEISMMSVISCSYTAPNARIYFLDNGGKQEQWRAGLAHLIRSHGHYYEFMTEPFNESRYYNLGVDMAAAHPPAKYTMFANCDLLFHADWLKNLDEIWERHPEYYCLAPYSGDNRNMGLCYRSIDAKSEDRIVQCDHASNWAMCFRCGESPRWDEEMAYWNADSAMHMWLKRHRRLCGVAYNSRVDHMADAVKTHAPDNFGFDIVQHQKEAERLFNEKWGPL